MVLFRRSSNSSTTVNPVSHYEYGKQPRGRTIHAVFIQARNNLAWTNLKKKKTNINSGNRNNDGDEDDSDSKTERKPQFSAEICEACVCAILTAINIVFPQVSPAREKGRLWTHP